METEFINHRMFLIDYLCFIKNFTNHVFNININSCDDLIECWETNLYNEDSINEAFDFTKDIIEMIKIMKKTNQDNYIILSNAIRDYKIDTKIFFDKFFDCYIIPY